MERGETQRADPRASTSHSRSRSRRPGPGSVHCLRKGRPGYGERGRQMNAAPRSRKNGPPRRARLKVAQYKLPILRLRQNIYEDEARFSQLLLRCAGS